MTLVIADPGDEEECRNAREELGFEPDHPHDTEVCEEFESQMCSPFFDGVDEMTHGLEDPPEYEEVVYEDIE